jgi:hypothetical protein
MDCLDMTGANPNIFNTPAITKLWQEHRRAEQAPHEHELVDVVGAPGREPRGLRGEQAHLAAAGAVRGEAGGQVLLGVQDRVADAPGENERAGVAWFKFVRVFFTVVTWSGHVGRVLAKVFESFYFFIFKFFLKGL